MVAQRAKRTPHTWGGSSWHASLAWHTPFASFIGSQAASKAVVLPFHSMCAWYTQRLDTKAACMLVALTGTGGTP